jgi:alpha-L-rhamnosidase
VSPNYIGPPEGPDLLASANYYRDALLFSKMAGVLKRSEDESTYASLALAIQDSFNSKYLDRATGIYRTEIKTEYRQTSNAVPLSFGMVPSDEIKTVVGHLADDVWLHNNHLNTGSFGTAALLPVLTENGHGDLAYAIASQTTFPSWGYWLTQGATAACEQWVYGPTLRSRDHAFLGSVDDWFFKYLAGIQPAKPGYKEIDIRPYVPGGLQSASASIQSPLGLISSSWRHQLDGTVELKVVIPPNATARVWIPGQPSFIQVGSGSYVYSGGKGG